MGAKRFLNPIVIVVLFLSMLGFAAPAPAAALAQPIPAAAQPGQPQLLPAVMPVFAIMPTHIDAATILGNAGLFSGIGASNVVTSTSPGGLPHFFAFNPDNHDIVDQFDHGGGLFVINNQRAFTETQFTVAPTNTEICQFLARRQLFPSEVEPQFTNCGQDPAYLVKMIHLSTEMPATMQGTNTVIGELVQIPLAINIGSVAPNFIPLGGPGGHMSLLLTGGPNTPSLDSGLPGLQALALPWFGRMRSIDPIGFYPVVPMAVAVQRFKASFPDPSIINAGTPVMVYDVGFPDTPQDASMPTWTFPDATAVISGTVVSLKDSSLPGVDGFAPNVSILSPADGSVFLDNQSVSLTFNVTGDKGPFTYTVSSDSNLIKSGVVLSGTHTIDLGPLPPLGGKPAGHQLTVHAVNSYKQPGEAFAFLGAIQKIYMPVLDKGVSGPLAAILGGTSHTGLVPPANSAVSSPTAPDTTLRIGVEWVMNYHNPSKNLAQTQPDAEGLYNWLGGIMGWNKTFDYGNDMAWEKDWRDCTLGGGDCTYGVDRAQFAYFSGHGSPSSFYFGVAKDYGGAWGGNARFQTVRWAGFSSCQTIRGGPYVGPGNPPLTDWFNSFQGSYMLLGFHSVMGDVPFGGTLGFNLDNPIYTIFPWMKPSVSAAWVKTAFDMNAGKPSYLYAVGNFDPANFTLPSAGSGPLPPLTGIFQFRWVWWDE